MEASKLIETLRFCGDPESCCIGCSRLDEMGVDGGTHACMCDLMQKAANAIEELESQLKSQLKSQKCNRDSENAIRLEEKQATSDGWIPVTERLPEDGQDVLGFLQNDTERGIFPANYDHGIWFDCLFNIHIQSVTHWMPLPEPPKGE